MRRVPAVIGALLVAGAVAPAGLAAAVRESAEPAPSTSSVSQYVELLPSAVGAVPLGRGSKVVARLAPAAQKALAASGGGDAAKLRQITVDPAYGAPAELPAPRPAPKPAAPARRSGPPAAAPAATGSRDRSVAARTPSPFGAAGSTLGAGGLWVLGLALLGITAGSVALARR